jgi:flagellar biosynthesis/type III secretory pathway chaperone
MKKSVQLHSTFNELAEDKTKTLTKGDISHLRLLIQKETALIKQLQQLEQERARLVRYFMNGKGLATEGGTLTELFAHVTVEEKEELISLQKDLIMVIEKLKKNNELNQQLIQDSLRFVNLSLDVLQPELDTGNYGRTNKQDDEPLGRSLFDSKA